MHLVYKICIHDIISGIFKTLLYGNIVTLVYSTGTGTAFDGVVNTLSEQCYFCSLLC